MKISNNNLKEGDQPRTIGYVDFKTQGGARVKSLRYTEKRQNVRNTVINCI